MTDRLAEIEQWHDEIYAPGPSDEGSAWWDDITWLIAEVNRLREIHEAQAQMINSPQVLITTMKTCTCGWENGHASFCVAFGRDMPIHLTNSAE